MDNYALVERLGQGSFAIVWKARRKSDNRLVAVKQLKQSPSTWEECKRLPEIRSAALVRGPHIISLLEAVRHGNELFLVFEYADSDLYRCLGPCERRRFEEPQVRWVMHQLFSALASMHAVHLVHCDVKPENLLLFGKSGPCGEPLLKLCDLGQATTAGEVNSYVGTRWYRAPELLLGVEHAGTEVDLWAAGCMMAELILLRPPFPGTDTRDMLFRICSALGAPEDNYSLSDKLMQASGLRFAPCAAEGPLWFELSSTGASSAACEIVRGMLRYDAHKRMAASRALAHRFFSSMATETPVLPPEKAGGLRSAEGMARSRDEAKAVSKKLQAASAARGMPSGPGTFSSHPAGTGLGGLGLMGSVLEVGPSVPSMSTSASTPILASQSSAQAGYSGHDHSVNPSSFSQAGMSTSMAGDPPTMGLRRTATERSGLPMANRQQQRSMQQQMQQGHVAQASQQQSRPIPGGMRMTGGMNARDFQDAGHTRDLTQGVAMSAGLQPPPREFHRPPSESWGTSPGPSAGPGLQPLPLSHGADRFGFMDKGPPSPDDSPIHISQQPTRKLAARGARVRDSPEVAHRTLSKRGVEDGGEIDDEEIAASFWTQVKDPPRADAMGSASGLHPSDSSESLRVSRPPRERNLSEY